jgi:uncharacterized membrane protein
MSALLLFVGAFFASAVEMVEALTIVLAVGVVRGWRSPLIGVGAATAVLAALISALGPALRLLPIDVLRLAVGALVHAPLARVPENAIKFAVGLLLTTFGSFWAAEGAGVHWPGGELALPGLLGFLGGAAFALTRLLHRQRLALRPLEAEA